MCTEKACRPLHWSSSPTQLRPPSPSPSPSPSTSRRRRRVADSRPLRIRPQSGVAGRRMRISQSSDPTHSPSHGFFSQSVFLYFRRFVRLCTLLPREFHITVDFLKFAPIALVTVRRGMTEVECRVEQVP